MRVPHIYQPISLKPGLHIELDERAHRHLNQVLRMRVGDAITVFDGLGQACHATIASADRKSSQVLLGEAITEIKESALKTHLGLGISKGERMDIAIQKAVELGVSEITPLFTQYCMVKLDTERQQKRLEHWQGVMISACEQCGRTRLAQINPIIPAQDWLENQTTGLRLVLDPRSSQSLTEIQPTPEHVSIYIGPEGGLSSEEIEQARHCGFQGVRLGPRVLRTETAVIAGLTAVQLQWGDLG